MRGTYDRELADRCSTAAADPFVRRSFRQLRGRAVTIIKIPIQAIAAVRINSALIIMFEHVSAGQLGLLASFT